MEKQGVYCIIVVQLNTNLFWEYTSLNGKEFKSIIGVNFSIIIFPRRKNSFLGTDFIITNDEH